MDNLTTHAPLLFNLFKICNRWVNNHPFAGVVSDFLALLNKECVTIASHLCTIYMAFSLGYPHTHPQFVIHSLLIEYLLHNIVKSWSTRLSADRPPLCSHCLSIPKHLCSLGVHAHLQLVTSPFAGYVSLP